MSDIGANYELTGVREAADDLARLTAQYSNLKSESEVAAERTQAFESAIAAAGAQAAQVRSNLEGAGTAQATMARSSEAATTAQRAHTRGMAEGVNMMTEMALGFGGLNPKLREFTVALAMGGNNAVQMAGAMGPMGIALGLVTGILPTLITQLATMGDETDSSASAMDRHAAATRRATVELRQFMATQRAVSRLQDRNPLNATFEEHSGVLADRTAIRDFMVTELEAARAELTRREREVGNVAARGGSLRARQASLEAVDRQREVIAQLDANISRLNGEVDQLAQRAQTALESEGAEELQTQDAENADREADRQRRRRGRGESAEARARRLAREEAGANRSLADDVLGELDEQREREAMAAEERERAGQRELDLQRQLIDLKQWAADFDLAQSEARKERAQAEHEKRMQEIEEQKQKEREANDARLAQAREITGKIGGALQLISSAYMDAFSQAIEGHMTLEQAMLQGTKKILQGIGEQMVAQGILETLEGFANIVANPPVAATKIPMGIAMIAGGVALGAAGAAIPSAPSAPAERPRSDNRGDGGGNTTLVLNYNSPMISAGTSAQLTRQFQRQIRDGMDFGTRRAAA